MFFQRIGAAWVSATNIIYYVAHIEQDE